MSLLLMLWYSACKPRHICPAYQSAFYLDKKIADEEFSPFDKDSMPKMEETVRKSDVLTIIRLGKKKIDKRMAIIPMITIFPEQNDSTLAMADSLAADSAMVEEENPEEMISDSSEMEPAPEPELPAGETPEPVEKPENQNQEIGEPEPEPAPKPKEPEKPKSAKKADPKDPEVSDPGLKAEFEESFEMDAKEEDLDMPSFEEPPPPSEKPKPARKPGAKKNDPVKPKEPEPEAPAEDDKF